MNDHIGIKNNFNLCFMSTLFYKSDGLSVGSTPIFDKSAYIVIPSSVRFY
ncbi:hypothetical protein SAMN05216331_1832 [Porphyromonadaceae bacterium KH3R12]|nr:hypothetical protein SAMN05216331_1832 [Porphyromonadaceae bacterium KH3R12]